MVEPRHRWVFPAPVALDPRMREAAFGLGVSARVAELLVNRGIAHPDELAAFFAEGATGLNDPRRLPDADVFSERIRRARTRGDTILVFGDFDADGLTGLAIMTLALRRLGIAVEPYVPSRLEEGHGLSLAAVERARTIGAAVIVTVDCGSTSVDEIAAARDAGIDVLVTDHHRVPDVLPNALAIVNPQRADSTYPDPRLAGSGVAFKLAQLLLAEEPDGPEAALDLADLAIVGAVADVAPILGENRAIARLGLARLRSAARPGFAALLERAGIAPSAADLEAAAFALAPRLNAAGRVGEALQAARLLLSSTREEADALAVELETANRARRDLTRTAVEEARAAALDDVPDAPAVVVRGPWPVGIVGLVASRLAEDLNRPAVVGAELGEVVRASCRSDGLLDLARALEACSDLFLRHGGHRGAAGFEIRADRWSAFRERFLVLAGLDAPADRRSVARLDLAVPASEVTYDLHRELGALAPCGPGNPEPLVAVLGLTVTRVRPANGGHTQLTLRRVRDVIDGIAFDRADLAETVREGDRLDVVGRIMSRRFGGFETLQIEIRDVAPSGHHAETRAILERDSGLVAAGGVA